jgi:hypothetical protein
MRDLTLFCLILFLSVSCNMDKGNTQNSQSKTGIVLLANNGFNDTSGSGSSANVHNTTSLTHDNVNSGEFLCYFYDSIYFKHDPGKDSSYQPQLAITLANLQPQMFSVTINFTLVNLNGTDKALLACAKNNDNGKYDTSWIPIDSTTRSVKVDSLIPGNSHIYYLNVFGLFKNTNLWFTASEIKVDYIDSRGK